MMSKEKGPDYMGAALLLLLAIVVLHCTVRNPGSPAPGPFREKGRVFVQVTGTVRNPGVYGFSKRPDLDQLATRAGCNISLPERSGGPGHSFPPGSKVLIHSDGHGMKILVGQMTAFYKMTLGIPVSLNHESADGLTALPGIGPGIARAIVREREARNGFIAPEDLLSVSGISKRLYRKIRPYVKP